MLDQSFSADNFRRILDLANRKGVHVEDKLSMMTIRRFNEQIRDCNAEIRTKMIWIESSFKLSYKE